MLLLLLQIIIPLSMNIKLNFKRFTDKTNLATARIHFMFGENDKRDVLSARLENQ